jgi:hypothetical protein
MRAASDSSRFVNRYWYVGASVHMRETTMTATASPAAEKKANL